VVGLCVLRFQMASVLAKCSEMRSLGRYVCFGLGVFFT
jgi:hypothetical protein